MDPLSRMGTEPEVEQRKTELQAMPFDRILTRIDMLLVLLLR